MTVVALLAIHLAAIPSDAAVAKSVHSVVRQIMTANGGRALFSELYNKREITTSQREYAARLYEVFFALPGHLAAGQRHSDRPPRRQELADDFGLSREAVDLLLEIAVSDPRLPKLLTRKADGEIASLDLAAIDAFVEQRAGTVRVAGWQGRPLPELSLTALDGEPLGSADLMGQPALLFLWLTRCPICRRVTPLVAELDRRYRDRGLQVVGLCADVILGLDVTEDERRDWLEEQQIEYRNAVLDAEARAALGNQNIFPTFFLVDAAGIVRRLVINEQDEATFTALLEELLRAPVE